jgi:cytochrome c oxidase subunit 2
MALAIVLILLVVGTIIFHFASPWWFTEIASNWGAIDTTVNLTFWVTGIVFIAVNVFLAWCIWKFHHHRGQKAHFEPESHKLEIWLTVITSVGVAAMLAPGLWVWAKFVEVPADAVEVEAVGQQWHWSFRYPGEDGQFGKTSISKMSIDNPFGIDPEDPAGQDDVLIPNSELHLQLDQPVKVLLRSKDVLHDFAVAEFRVKMDLVPGMVTYVWLTPTREGRFDLLCEEFCGIAHHAMRGTVVVENEQDYQAWFAQQQTFADREAIPVGDAVAGKTRYAACSACHGDQGQGKPEMNAPKLAGQEGWYLKKQLFNFRSGLRGAHEADEFGRQMVPMASEAMLPNESDMNDVVAYLDSLPDVASAATIDGDAGRGESLYSACAFCHGDQAQGIWALNAPRMAGMNDWYLARQLANFKEGVRGAHPSDHHGKQMGFMARILADEQAINDVVSYLNTLENN